RPHVPAIRQEIPTRRHELLAGEATTVVDRPGLGGETVRDDMRPDHVAVAAHDCVRSSLACRLVGEQCRVNTAENHPRAARADLTPDLIPTERVTGMDANAYDIPRSDRVEIERVQGFVNDLRIAPATAGRGSQDVQPSGGNDGDTKRLRARVNQMN